MNKITFLVDQRLSVDGTSGITADIDKIEYNIMTIEKELSLSLMDRFKNRELGDIFAVCQFICFLIVTPIDAEKTYKSMIFIDAKGDEDYAYNFFIEKKGDSPEDDNIELRNDFMKAFFEAKSNYLLGLVEGELVFDLDGYVE